MSQLWMVRAARRGEAFDAFKQQGCVAIGFHAPFDITEAADKEEVQERLRRVNVDMPDRTLSTNASVLFRFAHDIVIGDRVMTYDPGSRRYLIGHVAGPYRYDAAPQSPDLADKPHQRPVEWVGEISRDDLTPAARNSLGSLITLFQPSDLVAEQVEALLRDEGRQRASDPVADVSAASSADEEAELTADALADQSRELMKDRLVRLDWEGMEELVAAVLRAMGYKTRLTARGSDRGSDILASPDGLGLGEVRIRVEVKHRPREAISAPAIRSFIGSLRSSDRGLYVSTGGFTREAEYEAARAREPVALVDLDELARLIVQYYDRLDNEGQTLIPLIRIWWPMPSRRFATTSD